MRFLVVESENDEEREARRASAGKSSGESFAATLDQLAPGCTVELATPSDGRHEMMTVGVLVAFDGVFLSGSPLHVYCDTPETRLRGGMDQSPSGLPTPGG